MITLQTGLPGHGKTLYALWYINKYVQDENKRLSAAGSDLVRQVYYAGIKGVTLDWIEFEAEKWQELPHGSVIVIDECYEPFPKKPNGSKLPEYYEKLATHRHHGYDIFLLAQHPRQVDTFIKSLVERHLHSVRKFGMQRSTIYEWSPICPNPESYANKKSAISLSWKFPKEVFGWYKSAEVHTVRRSVPGKLILAAAFIVLTIGVCYYSLSSYQARMKKPESADPAALVQSGPARVGLPLPGPLASGALPVVDPLEDAKRYVAMNTPRVAGLPHTAPKYDEITKPVRVPVPAACIAIGSLKSEKGLRCSCYSQQGTAMRVDYNMCLDIAKNGYFQDFDSDTRAPGGQPQQQASLSDRSDYSRSYTPGAVTVIPDLSPPPSPRPSGRKG